MQVIHFKTQKCAVVKIFLFAALSLLTGSRLSAQQAYDPGILSKLIDFNKKQKTSRLAVSVQDSIIADITYNGKRDELYRVYSITKLFSGIAVGILLEKKLIKHPEEKIATYFEAWKSDPVKSKITIRHVLQHNSGLYTAKGSMDIYPQADFVLFALQDSVVSEPGRTYQYNNRAINLVSGLVHRITGNSLEQFIREHLFEPLDIRNYVWPADASGNTWGMDGLRLSAADLLKVGQMLANYGTWNGKQILSKEWCTMMYQLPLMNSIHQTGGYGMGIRTVYAGGKFKIPGSAVDRLKEKGLAPDLAAKLSLLADRVYTGWSAFGQALGSTCMKDEIEAITSLSFTHLIPLYEEIDNNMIVMHYGEIGQQIVVYPARKVVLVRFIHEKWGRKTNKQGEYKYMINEDMLPYVIQLCR